MNFIKKFLNGLSCDCEVLFLCSAAVDEIWIRTTLFECNRQGLTVLLAVCSASDQEEQELSKRYKSTVKNLFFGSFADAAKIKCKAVVTASSGLDRVIFPTEASYFIHMPHSLASLHMIYPSGAFDGYDMLFACGPHHVREFKAICGTESLTYRPALAVGYGKQDLLERDYKSRSASRNHSNKKHILLAPSWGPDNLLDRFGANLLQALESEGFRVTVRPHPLFILEQAPVIAELTAFCSSSENCFFESSLTGDNAIYTADLLIGDYSGASFEFYSLRGKPVLSVDVGKKVVNEHWQEHRLEPAELMLRDRIGLISAANIDDICQKAQLLTSLEMSDEVVDCVVEEFLFNRVKGCAPVATEELMRLVR